MPYAHNCRAMYRQALKNIASKAGMEENALVSVELDPRNSPYLLDENEGET